MTPTFTWQSGQLFVQENLCLKAINNQGMNVDRSFVIPLTGKPNTQDARPMTLPGRLVLPLGRIPIP